jgi:hypothetical protein
MRTVSVTAASEISRWVLSRYVEEPGEMPNSFMFGRFNSLEKAALAAAYVCEHNSLTTELAADEYSENDVPDFSVSFVARETPGGWVMSVSPDDLDHIVVAIDRPDPVADSTEAWDWIIDAFRSKTQD